VIIFMLDVGVSFFLIAWHWPPFVQLLHLVAIKDWSKCHLPRCTDRATWSSRPLRINSTISSAR